MLKDAEELGEKGQIEEAERLTDEVEKLRKAKDDLLLIAVNPTLASKQMKICEVCGAMQSINELEKRNLTHLEGKLHMGFDLLRKQLDILKKRLESVNLSIEVKKEEMLNEGRDPNKEVDIVRALYQKKGKVPERNLDFGDHDLSEEEEKDRYNRRNTYKDKNYRDSRSDNYRNYRNNSNRNRYRDDYRNHKKYDDYRRYETTNRYNHKNNNVNERERYSKREKRYDDDRKFTRRNETTEHNYNTKNTDRVERSRYDYDKDHERDNKDRRRRYDDKKFDKDDEYTSRHKRISKREHRYKDNSE